MKNRMVTRRFCRRSRVLLAAAAAVVIPLRRAAAQNSEWIGGSSNWNNAVNWAPAGVPGAGDTVSVTSGVVGASQTITYDYPGPDVALNQLTLDLLGGAGTFSEILSMSANNLEAGAETVGFFGKATFNQGGGANTIDTGALAIGMLADSSGTYTISGGLLNANGADDFGASISVGSYGTGAFKQTGGTTTANSDLDIAFNSSSTGNYRLSGPGTLSVGGNLNVGYFGTGAFVQSDGSNTVAGGLFLAILTNSTATFALSGTGSLSVSNGEFVGDGGTASFNQTGGVNSLTGGNPSLFVGFNANTTATYTLSGTGTLMTADGSAETIGDDGTGTFIQTGGVNLVGAGGMDSQLIMGGLDGSAGTYALSGTGSLAVDGNEYVGESGTGVFNQSGGMNTVNGGLYLGEFSSTGTFLLSGTGTVSVGFGEYVGNQGTGIFNQSGGVNLINGPDGNLFLGEFQGETGTYILSAGSVTAGGSEFVGDNGTGVFNQSGGVNSLSGDSSGLFVGNNFSATGTYLLSGTGLLNVSSGANENVGCSGAGVFNQTGGTNTLTGAGVLTLGTDFGSAGSYLLSGNGTLSVDAGETVGDFSPGLFNQSGGINTVGTALNVGLNAAGTYILSGTGTLFAHNENIGGVGGAGTFNQSGGLNAATNVTIDDTSSYTLSGGLLVGQVNEYVGYFNLGAFNQTSGTNDVPGGSNLYLGYIQGSTGSYTLSATGTLTAGSEYVGYQGVANFNQSSGTNAVTGYPGLTVGYDGPTSTYVLSGTGTLSSQIEAVGRFTAGIFNQSGGLNTVAAIGQNTTELDIAVSVGSVGVYNLTGGTLGTSNVYVGGAGPGLALVLGGAAGGTGTLTVKNTGSLGVAGILKVWNNGRVNLDVPKTNVGTLTLVNKGIVNLNGTLNINYGSPGGDPVASVLTYLKNGYNGGAWAGTSGIISTSAQIQGVPALSVGYADGNTDSGAVAAPNQIVVKFTLVGDANLDGTVGFADLVTVVQNFNKASDWAHGNFFYGATTNFNDLVAVVQSFNKSTPPPGGQSVDLGGGSTSLATGGSTLLTAGATIPLMNSTDVQLPEPGIAAVVVMAGLLASRRRRKVQWPAYDRITHRQI